MAESSIGIIARGRRRFAFTLALVALLQPVAANLAFVIASILPVNPALAAFADAGFIEICTAGGIKRVSLDSVSPEGGEDEGGDGPTIVLDYCPACHLGGQPAILDAAQSAAADYPFLSRPIARAAAENLPARRSASDTRNRAPPALQA